MDRDTDVLSNGHAHSNSHYRCYLDGYISTFAHAYGNFDSNSNCNFDSNCNSYGNAYSCA